MAIMHLPLIYSPIYLGHSWWAVLTPPLPDSFKDSPQAIISDYFHHSSSLALEFQLVSIQKKIAPFILSFMGLFTFIYCSAAFLIRYLKISPSPLTSDPAPFSHCSEFLLGRFNIILYIFQASKSFHYSFPLTKWDNGCGRAWENRKRCINTSSLLLLLLLL